MSQFKSIYFQNKLFFTFFFVWILAASIIYFIAGDAKIFFFVNNLHTPFLDYLNTFFSALGRGDIIALVLLFLLIYKKYRTKEYFYSTLTFGISVPLFIYITKDFFNRGRPLTIWAQEHIHTVPWLDNLYNNSFPSGHTFGAFGFFLILNHFTAGKKPMLTWIYFLLAVSCAYSRMYLGQHHFTDVIAGSIGGFIFSYCIISIVHKLVNK